MNEYFVTWYFLDQGMEGIPNLTPAFIIEKESYHGLPRSAYLTIEEANEAFDKITNYYREQVNEKPISILREVEI